jgi:predicted transcriptional regulator
MAKNENTFVSMRMDSELVKRIDELAAFEGVTRTVVIERAARREVEALRVVAEVKYLRKHPGLLEAILEGSETTHVEVVLSAGVAAREKWEKQRAVWNESKKEKRKEK